MTHTSFIFFIINCLSNKDASSSSSLDLLFSELGEELGLDDNRNSDLSVSEKLEVSLGNKVDNRCLSSSVLCSLVNSLSSNVEDLFEVEGGAELTVLHNVELAHTNLSEVPGMVLIEKGPVVVLSSSITTSTRMLTVLSNTSVSGGYVSSLLTVLAKAGRHIYKLN